MKGDRDPGYGSTSKMLSEAALTLLRDVPKSETGGGVFTPVEDAPGSYVKLKAQGQ